MSSPRCGTPSAPELACTASVGTDVTGSQEGHGGLVCELLAGDARYEVSAADQSTCLQAAQRPEDVPPGNREPLLEVDIPEHHAPAHQQLPGGDLRQLLGLVDRLRRRQ